MKYKENDPSQDVTKALGLDKRQVARIDGQIAHAYSICDNRIDSINALVAPYLKTPEEAFYAGQRIIGDILGIMLEKNLSFEK